MRKFTLAALVGLVIAAPAAAQEGWQFRWQAGQVLPYRVEHHTTVTETVGGAKTETSSKLTVVKRWQVVGVDGQGVATLQLSLASLRHEQTLPGGETRLFDSADLEKSTPELRERMGKFVGQSLAVLRVDGYGRVLEVKQGQAGRYESEPPFVVVFPAGVPQPGQSWARDYKLTAEPPQGTGTPLEATQRCTFTKAEGSAALIGVKTELKSPPSSPSEEAALLQKLPEGEVVFDTAAGRLVSARLRIDREVQGHQGEGSSYRFQSTYHEQFVTGN